MSIRHKAFIRLQALVPQHRLSRVAGWLAAHEHPVISQTIIRQFAKQYQIDMQLAQDESLGSYSSFNAFFTRALKPDARPIDSAPNAVTSPADGSISQLGSIAGDAVFQAKGQQFSLTQLLGGAKFAKPFIDGQFATVYLSPRDYHRVHMPFAGRLTDTLYIPGELFSVNGITAEHVSGLFARNERMVCLFNSEFNQKPIKMAVVLVGAMIVAGIETVATGKITPTGQPMHQQHDLYLAKGAELGRFYLGSTAIVIFPKDSMTWQENLSAGQAVKMGEKMGQIL